MEMELAEKSGGEPLLGKLSKTHGATISFHNICYKVRLDQNKSWSQCSCNHGNTGTAKTVLTDLNGIMKPGLNAIMGPTGSGKTTFLDVLAGRKDPSGVSGEVLIDGAPQPPNFKILSGYVVQEDVVMGYLTVRQNLLFSALLRLPSSLSLKERNDKVERIIQELGLGLVADSNVGTEFIRGISGGEKKRLNIGMELIIDPSVLFLDEPTTGLDASTANSVLLLLKTMAKKGHTIILSIHQPRYSIYKLFDNLTLLVNGKQVYHGPAKEALSYFSGIGYTCEPHNNPADFFLDVINGDSTAVALDSSTNNGEDFELVQSPQRGVIAEQLVEEYKNSSYFRHTQDELERLSDQKEFATVESGNITYNSGFFTQFFWIFIRSVWSFAVTNRTHFMRVPISLAMQRLCMMIYLSTFIGALFYDAPNDQKGIQNRFGAFFVATVNLVFGSISSAEFFISERKQYNHEYISGYYSVSAYFVAKVLADLVALRILPVFAFLILYFMIGLKITTEAISLFLGTLVLVSFTGSSATLAIGIAENTVAAATQNVTLFFLAMMLFAGLLVNLTSVPGWLIWMKYLSIPQYGCAALQINEFVGLNFTVNWNKTVFNRTGEQILEEQGVDHSPLGLWQNHLALTAMIMVSLFIAFGKLRLKKPYA